MTRTTSWTPDRVALLGTMPDAALARLIGLSTGAVLQARRSRGIPVYSAATSGVWVPIDPAQRERWQAAADARGMTLPEWIAAKCTPAAALAEIVARARETAAIVSRV